MKTKTDKETPETKIAPAKVEEFLATLKITVSKLQTIVANPKNHPSDINFDDYQKFHNIMDECLSFIIIIEHHLTVVKTPRMVELRGIFDALNVAIWTTLLEGSLGFIEIISMKENLPIGTRHIFVHEMKTLYDAEKTLCSKKYKDYIDSDINGLCNKAKKILSIIIEKAPSLLDMSIDITS